MLKKVLVIGSMAVCFAVSTQVIAADASMKAKVFATPTGFQEALPFGAPATVVYADHTLFESKVAKGAVRGGMFGEYTMQISGVNGETYLISQKDAGSFYDVRLATGAVSVGKITAMDVKGARGAAWMIVPNQAIAGRTEITFGDGSVYALTGGSPMLFAGMSDADFQAIKIRQFNPEERVITEVNVMKPKAEVSDWVAKE